MVGRVDALRYQFFCGAVENLPPTVNHLYRTARNGRRYKTLTGKKWQEKTSVIFARALADNPPSWNGPYEGRVLVDITFYVSDKRRWDIDNRVKAVIDCLPMAGIIKDDCQIDELIVTRRSTWFVKTATFVDVWKL